MDYNTSSTSNEFINTLQMSPPDDIALRKPSIKKSKPNSPKSNSSTPASNKKLKNVPVEFTSFGTTPSGKPRLFVCQVCTRAFARLEHLRRHERSHTKEKPFSCGVCQRKFSRRDLLLRHAQKLHAGCTDAITRLRRKSIKRSNSTTSNNSANDQESSSNSTPPPAPTSIPSNDPVEFNLNLFNPSSTLPNTNSKINKLSRRNSSKDSNTPSSAASTPAPGPGSNLHRQVFDRKRSNRNRGASFSAQSGSNYAIGLPEFNDSYPDAENVEFSTPQLLPSNMNDENSWLNNLNSIPGLSLNTNNDDQSPYTIMQDALLNRHRPSPNHLRNHSISSLDQNKLPDLPQNVSHSGSFSGKLPNDDSSNTFLNYDYNNSQFMMPTATISHNEINNANNQFSKIEQNNLKNHDDAGEGYGYSFYDIPDSMLLKNSDQSKFNQPLTPIKQEIDEDIMDMVNEKPNHFQHQSSQQIPRQHNAQQLDQQQPNVSKNSITTNGVNFDMNFLYDIDELTHEFDVNSKFMTGGYSFYGDNPSVSSSGVESSNSPNLISPSNKSPNHMSINSNIDSNLNNNFLNQDQIMNIENNNDGSTNKKKHSIKLGNYSKNRLFTTNMRYMINKSLSKYPISGIMTPSIPSNEKMEFYLNNFNTIFLSHFPFIHISKLNEYEIMNMTVNEDLANESARVCLPLLVATIGALLANNKNDSEHLYEASRRIIHIYLESRKNLANDGSNNNQQSVNPLWLIQSLTLSVIYGLFSDNENNVYIVIRQLNALNSLVKTSIKNNRSILFSINGDDDEAFRKMNSNPNDSLFSNDQYFSDELKFKNNINLQSQTRIVFMIYRLTNFLLMMYNVPLTLSINDLGNLTTPSTNDEFLWNFKNFQSFKEYNQMSNSDKNLDYYLTKTNSNTIVYKDILIQLTKTQIHKNSPQDPSLFSKLSNLSKYGFISVLHGLFEIKQYEEMKMVDIFSILDNLSKFIDNSIIKNNVIQGNTEKLLNNYQQDDFEKLDYALLLNFTKIGSIADFKLVKEQSWLRNFDELTKNYDHFLKSMNEINEFDYLRLIDCCIIILKLVLFKTDDANSQNDQRINSPSNPKGTGQELFHTELNYYKNHHPSFNMIVDDSLKNENSATITFEQSINLKVFDELDNSKNSIHSQMLFHVFTILSIFAIYVVKKNNPEGNLGLEFKYPESDSSYLNELNQRYITILKLLGKVENFLKVKYQNNKLENDFTNLCLFSNGNDDLIFDPFKNHSNRDDLLRDAAASNCFNHSIEKSLYILKLGESILSYMYDTNIKVSIFKKLSDSLLQIRKFLIDNEAAVLS